MSARLLSSWRNFMNYSCNCDIRRRKVSVSAGSVLSTVSVTVKRPDFGCPEFDRDGHGRESACVGSEAFLHCTGRTACLGGESGI